MRKRITLALLSMLLVPFAIMAQNVTISPTSGSLIAGTAGGNTSDSGLDAGFFTTWKHEQLALTMSTSDLGNLTFAGDLFDPSCATLVKKIGDEDRLVIAAGRTQTFMVVSLPKGYRITGYTAVLRPVPVGTQLSTTSSSYRSMGSAATCFYETEKWTSESPYTSKTQSTVSDSDLPSKYLARATNKNNENDVWMNPGDDDDSDFIITRDARYDDSTESYDMGNRLYFWIGMSADYYAFYIKSFEIRFTAQGTFSAEVVPTGVDASTNHVTSPFTTSKTDFGPVSLSDGRYTYSYANVKDIVAYNHIYQANAIPEGAGIPSDGTGDIHPVRVDGEGHYAFGSNTYYVEPPTTFSGASGVESPIGFRVVGVTFKPLWGTATTGSERVTTGQTCYVRRGTSNSYLNSSLYFESGGQQWQIDEYGNLFFEANNERKYLACYGEGDLRMLSLSSTPTGDLARWNLRRNSDNELYYLSDGGNYYYLYTKYITEGGSGHYRGFLIKSGGTVSTSNYTQVTTTTPSGGSSITLPSYTPGAYTIDVYDKTGTTVLSNGKIEISGSTDSDLNKEFSFDGFNNDAVKFVVTAAEGTQAMFDITLKLEALNPYIDQMTVNCTDESIEPDLHLTQTFTASDFGVNGGAFHFNLPSQCGDHDVKITFEDLYSHYGDETYPKGTGNARYSFVTSPYFQAFDGVQNNQKQITDDATLNDASSDNGLYDARYKANGAEYASTNKLYTGVAGDKAFKFNNAEVLTGGGTLIEYPFSVEKYLSTETGGTGGQFKEIIMNASVPTQNSGTYYLFTADETRYNIAPTSAWQHRSYAFYRMDVTLSTSTYGPAVEFKKVYDHTCYVKDGKDTDEPFYGAVVTAVDGDGAPGYASTDVIFKVIDAAIKGTSTDGAVEEDEVEIGTYTGKETTLTSAKQLLYLDFSQLAGIFQVTTDEHQSMEDLSGTNAENCLIFLPVGSAAPNDNVAYKTLAGTFQSAHDIVLTDKQPFFSPYVINLGENTVKYERKVTWEKYGATTKQSLILPFDLLLTNGTFSSGNTNFNVTKLTNENFADNAENENVTATFAKVSGNTAPANTPYMVDITSPSDGTFVIEQIGGTIQPTTGMKSDYMFYDTAVGAKYNGADHTFYPRGSFSGKIYDATEDDFRGSNVFFYYGSKDMFRSSAALNSSYKNLYAYPFRSFYGYSAAPGAKMLSAFMFSYGSDETDGISEMTKRIDFAVRSGKGYLEITSAKDANVRIFNLSGILMGKELMTAGETRTVNLPAGVYIVNGVKIIVK